MKLSIYISIFIAVLFLARPDLYAGEPIGGVNISIEQIPGGVVSKTKTNRKGEFSFKNLPDGNYILTVSYKGKTAVIGKKGNEKLVVASSRKSGAVILGGREKASGMATGKRRQHKPITITKQLDKSSPKLAKALVANIKSTRSKKSGKNNSNRVDKATPMLMIKIDGGGISGSLKASHQSASNSIRNMK